MDTFQYLFRCKNLRLKNRFILLEANVFGALALKLTQIMLVSFAALSRCMLLSTVGALKSKGAYGNARLL